MNSRKVTYILISFIMLVSLCHAGAQRLDLNSIDPPSSQYFSDVDFRIIGTSNVRDWIIVSDNMAGSIHFGPAFTDRGENSDNLGSWIEEVFLYIPNHSLDSGYSVMNQTMNKSLKSEKYNKLEYRMTDVLDMQSGSKLAERRLIVNGIVSAAGGEYELKHEVIVLLVSEETIRISGNFDLNMTDLGIDPPTFMRGALTTSNAVKVDYNFTVTIED